MKASIGPFFSMSLGRSSWVDFLSGASSTEKSYCSAKADRYSSPTYLGLLPRATTRGFRPPRRPGGILVKAVNVSGRLRCRACQCEVVVPSQLRIESLYSDYSLARSSNDSAYDICLPMSVSFAYLAKNSLHGMCLGQVSDHFRRCREELVASVELEYRNDFSASTASFRHHSSQVLLYLE